jgi:hypothetical protein
MGVAKSNEIRLRLRLGLRLPIRPRRHKLSRRTTIVRIWQSDYFYLPKAQHKLFFARPLARPPRPRAPYENRTREVPENLSIEKPPTAETVRG